MRLRKFVAGMLAVTLISQSGFAQSTQSANVHFSEIVGLIGENADGRNDAALEEKISNLAPEEREALLTTLLNESQKMQERLNEYEVKLSETNEPTLEVLRSFRTFTLAMGSMYSAITALGVYIEVSQVASSTRNRISIIESNGRTERGLELYGEKHIAGLKAKIEPYTIVKDGKYTVSFSKILKGAVKRWPLSDEGAATRVFGIVAAVFMAAAAGSELAISMIPETASDRDLLAHRDQIKKDLERLHKMVDGLVIHLKTIQAKFKVKQQ